MKLYALVMMSIMLLSMVTIASARDNDNRESSLNTEDLNDNNQETDNKDNNEIESKDEDVFNDDRALAQRAYAASSDEECLATFKEEETNRSDEHILRACKQFREQEQDRERKDDTKNESDEDHKEIKREERLKTITGKIQRIHASSSRPAEVQDKLTKLSYEQIEKLEGLSRSQTEKYLALSEDKLKEELDSLKKERVKTEDLYRKRVVAAEEAIKAQERFKEAKEKYEERKKSFEEKKNEWAQAIREGNEDKAIEAGKAQIVKAAEMILETFDQAQAQIEANDDLTEDDVTLALAELDDKRAVINAIKDKAENAETKEEVKAAASELKDAWERARFRVKVQAEKAVQASVGEIVTRSEQLEIKMDRILGELESNGEDIEGLDEKLSSFTAKIESAKEKYAQGQDLFDQAREENNDETFDQAKELVREAHEDLKEANNILMDLWKEIKASGYEGDLEEDEETDVIVKEEEKGDAEEKIAIAKERTFDAEELINEKEADGVDVTSQKEQLAEAKEDIDQSVEKYDAKDYSVAQEQAYEATKIATNIIEELLGIEIIEEPQDRVSDEVNFEEDNAMNA